MTQRAQPSRLWMLSALLFAITLAAYLPVLRAEFLPWDDDLNILENVHIRALTADNLHWMFSDIVYARRYMPLGWLGGPFRRMTPVPVRRSRSPYYR